MKRITTLLAAASLAAGCTDQDRLFEPTLPSHAVSHAISHQPAKETGSPFRGIELTAADSKGAGIPLLLDITGFEATTTRGAVAPLMLKGMLYGVDNPDLKEPVLVILAADLANLEPGRLRSCDGPVRIGAGIAVDNPDLHDVSVDNPDLLPAVQLEAGRLILDSSESRNRGRPAALICGIARSLESGDSWDAIAGQLDELLSTYELPAVQRTATAASAGESTTDAIAAIDDVLDRIVPSLGQSGHARALDRALSELRAAATAAHGNGMAARLAVAHEAVERHAQAAGDDAELDVIRMVLDLVGPIDPRAVD